MQPQLTTDQYQLVLKYMQATSEEDFESATRTLREYNFNLNTAINARFNQHQVRRIDRGHRRMEEEQDDTQVVRKYVQFIQRENESSDIITSTFSWVKNFTVGLVKLITQILLPETILRKILRSKFYCLYKDQSRLNIQDDKLVRLLMNTKEKFYKSCMIVVSTNNRQECIVEMLKRDDIVKKIRESFFFVGFVEGDKQIEEIRQQRPPQIIICRYNIYKELKIITRITGQQQIRQLTLAQLQNFLQQGRVLHKQDKNVLIKYRNFIRRQYYGVQMVEEEEEEEEVNFIPRHEDTREHIKQQNEEYERVAREEQKRLEEIKKQQQRRRQQQKMLQEKQQQRQCRKLSIPDQPTTGPIIRFSFRCPDGSNITRAFLASQKVQLLFHWVETNEQIELEDNKKREFEIMYSYPPTALSPLKERVLGEVFDGEQEKLLIREL